MDRFNCIQSERHVLDLYSGRIDQTVKTNGGDITKHIPAATRSCGLEFSGPRFKCFVGRVDCREGDQGREHTRNWCLCGFCIKVRPVFSCLNKSIFRKSKYYCANPRMAQSPALLTMSQNLLCILHDQFFQPISMPPSRYSVRLGSLVALRTHLADFVFHNDRLVFLDHESA